MTPAQCHAARELLGWDLSKLAAEAHVARKTVVNFESAAHRPIYATISALRAALEAAGVEFTDGEAPGVRLRKGDAG